MSALPGAWRGIVINQRIKAAACERVWAPAHACRRVGLLTRHHHRSSLLRPDTRPSFPFTAALAARRRRSTYVGVGRPLCRQV